MDIVAVKRSMGTESIDGDYRATCIALKNSSQLLQAHRITLLVLLGDVPGKMFLPFRMELDEFFQLDSRE
jgi:hypothetical protein